MANYVINDDGSWSKKKKNKVGTNYIINDDGSWSKEQKVGKVIKKSSSSKINDKKLRRDETRKKYNEAIEKRKEAYKEWNKKQRSKMGIFGKIGDTIKDAVWSGEEEKFNKKYDNKEINKLRKQLETDQYDLDKTRVENEKITAIDKIADPIFSGIEEANRATNTTLQKASSVIGNNEAPRATLPSYDELHYNKVKENTKSKLGRIYQDLTYTTGNMMPSMLMPNPVTALGTTAVTSFGSSYRQAKNEGKTESQATKYGLAKSTLETGLQKLLGGLSSIYGKSATGKIIGGKVDKVLSKVISSPTTRQILSEASSEFTEEYLQEILEPVVRNITLDENNKFKPFTEEALYSGILGALNSGFVNTTGLIGQKKLVPSVNDIKPDLNNQEIANKKILSYKDFAQNTTNSVFSKQVDEVLKGTFPQRDMLTVSESTPKLLQDIGLKDLPITLTQKHLDTIMNTSGQDKNANYHGLGIDLVKQLPQAISNPLNVLKSDTKSDSIVLITELVDNQDRPVIASIKIDGTGRINDVFIDSNVMTSAYGRNNYDKFMRNNITKGNLLYDIDEGIIKRSDRKLQLQPTTSKKEPNTGGKVQFPTISNTRDRAQFPIQGSSNNASSISYDDNITQLKQNVKLPSVNNMQQTETKIPTSKDFNKKIAPSNKAKIKQESKRIADEINETMNSDKMTLKQRKWTDTATESEVLKDKIYIEDLDPNKIVYTVKSNKSTLEQANAKLNSMEYDDAVNYIKNRLKDKDASLSDIALAERLIQEAAKKGDTAIASDLLMDVAIVGTDLGQKVQALSMIQRLTPEGQLKMYQKLVERTKSRGDKTFQDVVITPEMVEKILGAYKEDGSYDQEDLNARVESFKQDVANQLKTTTSEKINEWRYLSMLGNPKTHIRNMISNIAMNYTTKYKNAVARTIETVVPIKNRTKTWKSSSKEVSNFAKTTTEEMKNIISGNAKYNEKTSIVDKKQIFKSKVLDKISDFNSKALEAEDWFFSKRAFESTLKEYLTANKISTQEDIKNNPEVIEKGKLYALEQAEVATFRQYSKLASVINKFEKQGKISGVVTGAIIPFKKTPINVAKTGIKYSPIGLIKSMSYDAYQVKKGNMEASQMIDNLSQGLTGTSIALIGYALAKAGFLTGAGDDDKEGKYDSQLGNQGYAFKIDGSTYSLSWLSPVAMPLLVGANFYEKLEEQEGWDMNVISDTLAQTLDPLSEMSFVSSLTDVLTSYGNNMDKLKGAGESMAQSYIGQFFPTLFSQLASTLDDKKRSTKPSKNSKYVFGEQTIRNIMYKIPGLRKKLEVSTDIWGNEVEQSENIIQRAVENFIAPYSKKKDITTSLDNELKNVYKETGESGVIPGVPYSYLNYSGEKYQMSASEYTQYKKTYGHTANEGLNSLINNRNYKNASPEEKAKMIKEIFGYASVFAKEEYFKGKEVSYSSSELTELNKLKQMNMSNDDISEYVALNKLSSTIKNNNNLESEDKKLKISEILSTAKLNDEQLSYLYDKYYSSDKTLSFIKKSKIPIKQYIKFNAKSFESDKDKNGKTIKNSRRNKMLKYVNTLNLTAVQKAMLIKTEYSSYDGYDKQIISYVNSQKLTRQEKEEILKKMGFTIKNGRVY